MADTDTPEVDIAKAKRLVMLAMIVLVVGCLVLAIDYRLKNYIIKEGKNALLLLDRAQFIAERAEGGQDGGPRADGERAGERGPVSGPDDTDGAGPAAADDAASIAAANGSNAAPVRRSPGTAGGPRGHGGRAGGAA